MTDSDTILDFLEAPLLDEGLDRVDLPDRLANPVPDDHGGAIVSRAYQSDTIRWARTTRLAIPEFQGVNVLVFPADDLVAPILGIDLADDGLVVSNFIVDLWGLDQARSDVDWTSVRHPFESLEVDWTPGSSLEGPKGKLVSDDGLFARSSEGICPLDAALEAISESLSTFIVALEELSRNVDAQTDSLQREYCRLQANKPGGRDMLADVTGDELADQFLERVFYPEPGAT
jgi:hypothetical protein